LVQQQTTREHLQNQEELIFSDLQKLDQLGLPNHPRVPVIMTRIIQKLRQIIPDNYIFLLEDTTEFRLEEKSGDILSATRKQFLQGLQEIHVDIDKSQLS
jgi:hypothetical protein